MDNSNTVEINRHIVKIECGSGFSTLSASHLDLINAGEIGIIRLQMKETCPLCKTSKNPFALVKGFDGKEVELEFIKYPLQEDATFFYIEHLPLNISEIKVHCHHDYILFLYPVQKVSLVK